MDATHRLTFSIDKTTNTVSIVDMINGTALRVVGGRPQSNNIDVALVVSHLHNLQNQICRTDLPVTQKRFWLKKAKTFQIIEDTDAKFEIKYEAEKAIYSDTGIIQSAGYNKTYVLSIINSIYEDLFSAAVNTVNKHSTFQHDFYHDLLICQTTEFQIVGKWSNFYDGILHGALVNGVPFDSVILVQNETGKEVDVFDNSSKLLFTMPFDSSANIIFNLNGDKTNVPKFAI